MFNFFKNKDNKGITIENLFDERTYQPYVKQITNKDVRNFFWECKDIQDSLNKIILKCEKVDTPESRYYKAISLAWSRIEYNDKAIKALEEYLKKEPYISHGNKDILRASTLGYLGKAYEKKYDYDMALNMYKEQSKLDLSQIPLISISEIYRKQNNLDSAIKLMEEAMKSDNKEISKDVIKNYLKDYKDKKEKGYIFRDKKRK